VLYKSIFNSGRPISCVYLCLSVTDVLVSPRPFIKVPYDFSHKTNNCKYISQHQKIECCLQVYDTNSIVRVIESRNIQFLLHIQFIQTSFFICTKISSSTIRPMTLFINSKREFPSLPPLLRPLF